MFLFCGLFFVICACATQVTKRVPNSVPAFVIKYAPIVYLYSEDPYRPSDIAAQLTNTIPRVNFTTVTDQPLTLSNISSLNNLGGEDVYLTSKIKPDQKPGYIYGVLPNEGGETVGAVSGTIIVNDHEDGIVDVFYFYFYPFDRGALDIGDHVGDWEHTMIRFQNETPSAIWYSQHSNGQAFKYKAVQKYADGIASCRPVVYSANGSHANYATDGTHAYGISYINLPAGIVEDHTDQGPLWDPIPSAYWYSFDNKTHTFAAYNATDPTDWLAFNGHWGDQQYPQDDPSQSCFLGFDALCRYTDGPTGPAFKQLQREKVCPESNIPCIVRDSLEQKV